MLNHLEYFKLKCSLVHQHIQFTLHYRSIQPLHASMNVLIFRSFSNIYIIQAIPLETTSMLLYNPNKHIALRQLMTWKLCIK